MRSRLFISVACVLALGGAASTAASADGAAATQDGSAKSSSTRGVRILRPEANEVRPVAPVDTPPPPPVQPAPAPAPAPYVAPQPAPSPVVAPQPAPAPAPAPAPVQAKCDRAFPRADLVFADSGDFDRNLSAALAKTETTAQVVDVTGFAPDTPPSRLDAWFGEIQRTGGSVGRKEIICSRGLGLFRALSKLFGAGKRENLLAPAKDYDAVLWIERATGTVRQVQFVRRT